jgi:hypothetical protein
LCACKGDAAPVSATTWPEADRLFYDARWLGADGAYSVDLGRGRVLWLFGDTDLAKTPGGSRDGAFFLRNSAAVQTGSDPSHALMRFAWGVQSDGSPRSFVAEEGTDWFWPGGGARIGDAVVLFYGRLHSPESDPHGFEQIDWRVVVVENPDEDPSAWTMHDATLPRDSQGVSWGSAVLLDGDFLYAYGERGGASHDIAIARWPRDRAGAGDLSSPEYFCGDRWEPSCASGPAVVVPNGAPELSVHADGRLAPFVMVQTEGYGASTLALRTAPAPEGPWSNVVSFFRPPESLVADAFVYAGKAHRELAGADLVATYVPSLFHSTGDTSLYRPHFVRITYR